jgi:hypothetical protein
LGGFDSQKTNMWHINVYNGIDDCELMVCHKMIGSYEYSDDIELQIIEDYSMP